MGRSHGAERRDWVAEYCRLNAHSEAPEKFHFWTAVSTLAGAIRRHVYLDQGSFRLYPNFYIIFVGEPGIVTKSTAISIGLRYLRDIGAPIGPNIATPQGFLKRLEGSCEGYTIGGGNLTERKHISTHPITAHITEWGTFFDPRDHQMVNWLTDLYDCKDGAAIDKVTATQGDTEIVNPFVNILSGTTPGWLRTNVRGTFVGWGLLSRIVFVYADRPRDVIAYPKLRLGSDTWSAQRSLTAALKHISSLRGEFTLSPEVTAYGQEWREKLRDYQIAVAADPDSNQWLKDFLARKFDHAHKLALVLSLARRDSLVLQLEELQEAIRRMDEVEAEILSIFGTVGHEVSNSVRTNRLAWAYLQEGLRANERIPRCHVHQFLARYLDYRGANALLEQLREMQYISQEQTADGALWIVLGQQAAELAL